MNPLVVDTSVVVKWFRELDEEPHVEVARKLLRAHTGGRVLLVAPDVMIYELGNAISRTAGLSIQDKLEILDDLADVGVETVPLEHELHLRAMAIASADRQTYCDACFVALAEALDTDLVTADELLARRASYPGVRTLAEIGDLTSG